MEVFWFLAGMALLAFAIFGGAALLLRALRND